MSDVEQVTARDYALAVQIFGAARVRPAGQPGTVRLTPHDGYPRHGYTYPAVRDDETGVVRYWRDTTDESTHWIVAPPVMAESFVADEEWKADCDHVHALPWQTCAFEADCVSLRREEARAAGGDWS